MRINRLVETIMILINNKDTTVKYLSNYFEVSRKTIYGDLDILLTSGIPISYGDNNKGKVTILSSFDFHQKFQIKEKKEKDVKDFDYYQKYVNNEQHLNYSREMWERFTTQRKESFSELDSSVFHSWIRCQQNNVPIYAVDSDNLLTPSCLKEFDILKHNDSASTKLFVELCKHIGWYVMIYDTDCQLTEIINPIEKYDRIFPRVGYKIDAREIKLGTNAVALATLEKKTRLIMGAQHYNKSFHEISCVAAPVFYDGDLYGTLNVAFIHNEINPEVKDLVRGMARLYETLVLKNHNIDLKVESILNGPGEKFFNETKKELFGVSKAWHDIMNLSDNLSILDQDFMLIGDKGIGKYTITKYIHSNSSRKFGPCLIVDFSKISNTQQKKVIFGTETNDNSVVGKIEEAHGGTLIIKNPEYLNPELLTRWISFLKHKHIKRVGSKKWKTFDVRVVLCYSNFNLDVDDELRKVLPLACLILPSLKDRPEDSETIIKNLMKDYFKENGFSKRKMTEFIKDVQDNHLEDGIKSLKKHLNFVKNIHIVT